MKGSGRVEYVFVGVNEEIEIKLQTQYFSNVQTREEACSDDEDYSDLKVGANTLCVLNSVFATISVWWTMHLAGFSR